MDTPAWLSILGPVSPCRFEWLKDDGKELAWHATFNFTLWVPGPNAALPSREETYGKTVILRPDGHWSVVEIELTRRLREAGWQAGWLDSFGRAPKEWAKWLVRPSSLPSALARLIGQIDAATGRRGRKPDIIAWREDSIAEVVFLECKGPGDQIRPKQVTWLNEALVAHMSLGQYAVA